MTTRPVNGTQKADVYSFAIVLQEIVFRAEPYFIDIDHPQRAEPYFYDTLDIKCNYYYHFMIFSSNFQACRGGAIGSVAVRGAWLR